jgi:plasmid stabilization system protein ParE
LTYAVVVTEAAERDINAAALWYEREAVGLGRQFLDAISATLTRIENNPQQFPLA